MAETQETHADIIAEMRMGNTGPYPFAYLIGRAGGLLGNVIEQVTVKELADRLEAAHRRELAASGNAAKLREALAPFPSLCEWLVENAAKLGISDMVAKLRERGDKARAALSAPPRNCDRFATVEDARKAHEAICEKYSKCHNGCPLNNEEHYSAFDCFEAWLFAPAAEQEGGAK